MQLGYLELCVREFWFCYTNALLMEKNSYWILLGLILIVSRHDVVASYYAELNKKLCDCGINKPVLCKHEVGC